MTKSNVKRPLKPSESPNGSKSHGRIVDVVHRTGMTHWAVEEAIRSGDLPAIKPGKHYIISMADADKWMERLKRRDASQIFGDIKELNAWLRRHGYQPVDPNAAPPTDKEAQAFFEGCKRDEDGNIIVHIGGPEED